MPIPDALLKRTLIPRILTPSTTIAELLYLFAEQPEPHRYYAVVQIGPDAYDVLTLNDLQRDVDERGAALLPLALGAIPGLLKAGAPLYQSQVGQARAEREMSARHRGRLVVLNDAGQVVGLLTEVMLGVPKGVSPLALIGATGAEVLDPRHNVPPPAPPALNTRFDGIGPNDALMVGQRIPLIISVGAPTATNAAQSTRPFRFDFAGADAPVPFTVHVDADPEMWTLRIIEPTLIVAPPGTTTQEAEFLVTAKSPGRDKLHLTVERDGVTIQHIWLPVVAALPQRMAAPVVVALARSEASLPLDATGIQRPTVELTIQPSEQSFVAVVRADLPDGVVRATYRVPVSGAEIQNAVLRLRQELKKVVYYADHSLPRRYPFANGDTLTVDLPVARQAYVPLADAGQQVWNLLFNGPRAPEGLKQLAADLRTLPHGCLFRVVLDSQQFIVPWALLYDAPGAITADTLDWSGFWGYRFILDVLPPGRYPAPAIDDPAPGMLLLFNDDESLRPYTTAQEQFVHQTLRGAQTASAWGQTQVAQMLVTPPAAALVYCYCHGTHTSGAVASGSLASESAVYFSGSTKLRLADLRRLPVASLSQRPVVFLNACEGATQDTFYYDGFMPFFMEEQGARGFIGTEVQASQLLAHDVALHFLQRFAEGQQVGTILWQLRRHYLEQHNNILGFNYSLYCPGEVRLATPLLAPSTPTSAT